jgi:translation initiation factor 2 beta subunit (eIF-2beta)/eIF-5
MNNKNMGIPKITIEGKEYYMVGCKICVIPEWNLYHDGKEFVIKCKKCGNTQKLTKKNVRDKPVEIYERRFFD